MKEKINNITIQIPDGYEIDKKKSSCNNIILKEKEVASMNPIFKDLTTFNAILWHYVSRRFKCDTRQIMGICREIRNSIETMNHYSKSSAAKFKAHIIQCVMFDVVDSTLEKYIVNGYNCYRANITTSSNNYDKDSLGTFTVLGGNKSVSIESYINTNHFKDIALQDVYWMPTKSIAEFVMKHFWRIYITIICGDLSKFMC